MLPPMATPDIRQTILEIVLDAGADEVNDLGDSFEIISEATDFVAVRKAIQDAGIDYDGDSLTLGEEFGLVGVTGIISRPFQQEGKNLEGLFLQFYLHALLAQFSHT